MESKDINVSLFEYSIPPFVEADMERLYQHLFATVAHHRAYGGISDTTSTYIVERNGQPVTMLLFQRDGNTVRVLNEQIRIDGDEIDRFAHHVFTELQGVDVITFHAVDTDMRNVRYPHQRYRCTEDIVLTLPADTETYRASLGKSTRSYINRYMNKLRRDFPTMQHEVYENGAVKEEHVRRIIELNTVRMNGKNRETYIDEAEAERIVAFARSRGLLSIITIDGVLYAGTINFRVGDNYFLKVIAHDPAYNDYRLGTLCCYLTICECIARGGKEYHFLWGRFDYKYRLLGVQHDLDHVTVYRSRAHMLRNGSLALRNAYAGSSLQAREWLLQKSKQEGGVGSAIRLGAQVLHGLRRIRQVPSGLMVRKNTATQE